jgi:hypothetical protein
LSPRPQLLQAVYAICAAISAGNLRTMLTYVNSPTLSLALPLYDESNAFDENARVAEALAIQLLVADSIGGIIICGVYFLFSGVRGQRSRLCRPVCANTRLQLCLAPQLVLLGRVFKAGGKGVAYGQLMVATWYTFLVLFALAGTLSVCDFKAARAFARCAACVSARSQWYSAALG